MDFQDSDLGCIEVLGPRGLRVYEFIYWSRGLGVQGFSGIGVHRFLGFGVHGFRRRGL